MTRLMFANKYTLASNKIFLRLGGKGYFLFYFFPFCLPGKAGCILYVLKERAFQVSSPGAGSPGCFIKVSCISK